ncbi:hypothetical protein [Maridesulfovibrio ferrireducens]|uniref:hypothetical protein n=1 Tax=Maridesulfovibrio ferrireducens TaxID=246191 RepID=UPI001A2163A8|nr:hypothetical protein [Maridesulfovibrio ferrireducens]MBI9111947.1 hypothetical protein [Maridesulfovibrio ferrireducens]
MDKVSFNAYERELEPGYRAMIDKAESTEDIRKFYERTALDFLQKAVGDQFDIGTDSLMFAPDSKPGYLLSPPLMENADFQAIVDQSDLTNILNRFTERAVNKYAHMDRKHPDKTEAKINPTPGQRNK